MIIDPDMPDHWKTRMLVDLLGGDELAPLYLIRLWGHCQNRKKSEFDSLPPAAVKAICRFPGDADALDSALTECGFIERDGNELTVTGWAEHNASLVANWENGKRGGRPRKNQQDTDGKAKGNPEKTHGKPSENPCKTDREDREEKIEERREESPQAPQGAEDEYPPEFERLWADYPKRAGGNPKKAALKAWKARIKSGVDPQTIADGVARYTRFCAVTGKVGTEYVKQASTFFGPDEHYLNDWTPPPPKAVGNGGTTETPRERAIRMAAERGIPYDPQ